MALPTALPGAAFTRAEARAAGVTDGALARRARSGDVRRVAPALWCATACPDRERVVLAALTRSVPGAVASHASAARRWGIDSGDRRLHVTVPAGLGLRSRPGLVVHRDALRSGEVTRRGGMRLTDPYRTVLDVACGAPLDRAVVVADALLWAELVERQELLDRLARRGRGRGSARARRALALSRYGAASPGETRLRLLLTLRGVPEPVLQHRIATRGGPVVADLCWPRARLVVEYDGFAPHTERATFERDRRRWSWLREAGWELRAYTAESVRDRADEVAREVTLLVGP